MRASQPLRSGLASYGSADLLGPLRLDSPGQELLTLAYSPACTVNVFRRPRGGHAAVLEDHHAQLVPPWRLAAV
ncbi:MAG TPA: hypothetical protein VJ376_03185 [Pseudomonadota bacterium]|nr:hypothetical protein [Pseudomonadota bacterium]